ncbi:hypothetical protein [Rhizobium sp. TH135]|nr:hypothetical protein [Rhizobium sp. TH135]
MKPCTLGGLQMSEIGFGIMSFASIYGASPSQKTVAEAEAMTFSCFP